MKGISLLLLIFLSHLSWAQVQQDIVFKARFDLESSEAFINQLRIFLENNKFGDPYSQTFSKPIVVDLAKVINETPLSTQSWLRELQNVLKIKLFESEYRLVVDKLGYSVQHFNSEFRPGKSSGGRVEYVTVNYVKGLHLHAERVAFEVELKQNNSSRPLIFDIEIIEPEFMISPDLMAETSMGWATSILEDDILLSLELVDIKKIMQEIIKNPDLINLKYKDIVIPDVSMKVGSKTVRFDKQKIKKFLIDRQEDMKCGVLDLLNLKLNDRFGNVIQDSPKSLLLPGAVTFKSDVSGVVDIQKMDVNNTGIVQFDIDGHFCEDSGCRGQEIKAKERRSIDIGSYNKSLREMNRSLIERQTNLSLSVSENYLNQMVEATIKTGLWDRPLSEKDLVLGPEKAFVLADEKGELFSLYMDVIHKLSRSQRILVGKSEIRFPIKFMIALNIEEVDGLPHFLIKVKKVATDRDLLIKGLPQYGLPTFLNQVRFQNKVMKKIMSDVSSFEGRTLVDFELKDLKGTYLHDLKFTSDGQGRGSATIGFKK
ncbi:MAG: hypothetical protein NDI69_12365 [Bacteriovoracaceae bacterium]|nr:hypothetical protein [Bacteriovoracaceae bacterium]